MQLIFFEPDPKEFKQLALYKVADGNTYAYPVISSNRIFIKDKVIFYKVVLMLS